MCEPITVNVPEQAAGLRVDVFLTNNEEVKFSRNALQKMLADGDVTCKTRTLAKSHRVTPGEVITLRVPEAVSYDMVPEAIPLDIVYEDHDIIVINKPRGLVVHPAAGHFRGTLVNALLHHCGNSLSGIGGVKRPGIVHRLDKDTSGLLVAAKNDTAHQALSEQLANRTMKRVYRTLCLGRLKPRDDKPTITVNAPIGRHPVHRQKMAVREAGRNAVTHFTVLGYLPNEKPRFTYLEARLETGRTHQIRVHLAYLGFPVLGDVTYGPEKQPCKTNGQILHALQLGLIHPTTKEPMVFETELPDYFTQLL